MLYKNAEAEAAGQENSPVADAALARSGVRFERRRADILAAAIPILNSLGFKGMRLTAVAEAIGLRSTSVTYYFPRKEELVVACLESAFEIFHRMLEVAEREPDARQRLTRFVSLFVEHEAEVRLGRAMPMASFASLRSLEGAHLERAAEGYRVMYRRVHAMFKSPDLAHLDSNARSVRTLICLEQLFWTHDWLIQLDLEDYPRAAARMTDIMLNGLAVRAEDYAPDTTVDLGAAAINVDPSKEAFLRAATRQINIHGYSGASVDRISASLNVTKGAFYHHNDGKDDLVAACFRRSFGIMASARRLLRVREGSEWWRLTSGALALVRFQVSDEGPMLATGVLFSMPRDQQATIIEAYVKTERAIAAMISDAIAEGHARPVDPMIAARLLVAAINCGAPLRQWRQLDPRDTPESFCRAVFLGLLTP